MTVVAARLEETTESTGQARRPRRRLLLEASGATATGTLTDVLVHNISATGLLIESPAPMAIGDKIEIALPEAGATSAKIIWASDRFFGCEFESAISLAALGAAQLRAAPQPQIASGLPAEESLGARLQRLRKARGLPLSQVAAQLGVSKPTVWAWEQGRARPASGRIDALAEALGVTAADLRPGGQGADLDGVVSRSRDQIARAAGVAPDKVRIMIEL